MRSIHICFIYLYVWKCVCVCACVYRCELEPKTDTRVFLSHSSPCLLRGHLSLSLRLADLARLRPASLLAHLPLSPLCLVVTSGDKTPVCVLAQRAFNTLQELPMRLRDYSYQTLHNGFTKRVRLYWCLALCFLCGKLPSSRLGRVMLL